MNDASTDANTISGPTVTGGTLPNGNVGLRAIDYLPRPDSLSGGCGPVDRESFEGAATSPRSADPISLAAFTVTPAPGLIEILDEPAGGFGASATDGTKFLFSYRENQPAGTLRFDLTAPATAFGFFLIDDGETDGLVSLHTDAGETLAETTVLQAPPLLPNGNVTFFGFVQKTPFLQVFLTSTGIDDSYGLDQVYTTAATAVPEPDVLLFGLALVLPAACLRQRSRKIETLP